MKEYFCHVNSDPYRMSLLIYMGMKDGEDVYLLRNNVLEKVNITKHQEPTIKLSHILISREPQFLQSLVDGLIKFGVKPSEPLPDNNELKAVKYHLEDMRKIVFKKV